MTLTLCKVTSVLEGTFRVSWGRMKEREAWRAAFMMEMLIVLVQGLLMTSARYPGTLTYGSVTKMPPALMKMQETGDEITEHGTYGRKNILYNTNTDPSD